MQHIPKWILLAILFFILLGTAVTYSIQSYRYNDITTLMRESAQVVIVESVDNAIRTNENSVVFSEELFEEKFKERFEELKSDFDVKEYSFDYRKQGDFYKAVKVKIIDDQNTPFEITFRTDLNNS